MDTHGQEQSDLWTLVHDLVFAISPPVLVGLEYLAATIIVVLFAGCARRVWSGDAVAIGPLRLGTAGAVRNLRVALDEISKDDKLKATILWMFRDRLNEASRVLGDGAREPCVQRWCGDVLTDVATALSRGGHDRHRASLWIPSGDGLRMFNAIGFRQAAVDAATLPLNSIAGNVLQTGTVYNSRDVESDRAFCPKRRSGRPYQSLLAVPVKTPSGTTIATLCIDAEARGYFDDDDEFFASCFADLIALLASRILSETLL